MKSSIITVNLNNRKGVQPTIKSVATQTLKDFEWLVIDGGSTDGSKEPHSLREAFLQTPGHNRNNLIARGRERAKPFSWEENARKLSHVYKIILA